MTPLAAYFVQHGTGIGARLIQIVTRSPVNHAGVNIGPGQVIEALSAGATIGAEPPDGIWSHMTLTDQQRTDIATHARSMEGTPYGWLDVIALGVLQYGIRLPSVLRRVQRTDHLFCSQLVDEAYRRAGVHLFDDGRAPQDVTPGDLYDLIRKEPPA